MVIGLIACLAACKKEQPQSPIPDSPASLQKLFNPAYGQHTPDDSLISGRE